MDIDVLKIAKDTLTHWFAVFMPHERVFVLYAITAIAMAYAVWVFDLRKRVAGDKGFLRYVFDRDIYTHKSAVQDYWIFLVNGLLFYGILIHFLVTEAPFAYLAHNMAETAFGHLEAPVLNSLWSKVAFTIVYVLAMDFAVFYTHYLQHKIPALWSFHKVHHSAEVLTPVTLFRMHPVDLAFTAVFASMLTGLGYGLFSYLSDGTVTDAKVLGINAIVFLFYFAGYNLRHSHVWLAYPQWLSNVLVSPAQHQIHHSTHPKHFDMNMGLIFSFWDKLFGTLYVPKGFEQIEYGISRKERNPYQSTYALFIAPFAEVFAMARNAAAKLTRKDIPRYAGRGFFCLLGLLVALHLLAMARAGLNPIPSVYFEELTWPEVALAMDKAQYDTVIIPTGGLEQGGPRLVLGKHNYIVRHTAGEIAKHLGRTFVAPVISYVPEGDIDPPTLNMRWPGGISVPDKLLEDTLFWAARGYLQQGFKHVFFIGDHGLSQKAQAAAAERLQAFAKNGATITHVGAYYDFKKNGQVAWLLEQGHTPQDIGTHAGLRDVSELDYVHDAGVRQFPVTVEGREDGVQGNPARASSFMGKKMIDMKIDTALAVMRAVRGDKPDGKQK
jgi:sterol desaturase/sphingolipid hydroxylase (fatty acid hydroxylase superfamily)/creatinine amidohydrolase/Fe(II)-dependent formamide hydrolase-like protein